MSPWPHATPQQTHHLGKVAIVDWDVHHGNGTQNIFYEDPSVFFFSTHQSPWYPYTGPADETGQGAGLGTTMNFPFAAGAGRPQILGAMQDKLLPALQAFKPELILISAGFDSKLGDPLGQFELTDPDFTDMTRLLMTFAREHCENRVVSILEGGVRPGGPGQCCSRSRPDADRGIAFRNGRYNSLSGTDFTVS